MREGRLNLLPSLFSVYNDNECDETSHLLAKYLLENFDRLDELTVNDLMDAAFVSRSGVRRFCQSIGFGNFSEVRDAFVEWEMFRQYYLSYSLLYSDVKLHLREDLSQMFSDIDRLMTPATTQKLCNDFHEARHVVLLTSDSSSASLINFQRAMTMLKRLVQMVTESAPTTQTVRSLTSEDLLVVVSASGSFAHAQHEQIEASGRQKGIYHRRRGRTHRRRWPLRRLRPGASHQASHRAPIAQACALRHLRHGVPLRPDPGCLCPPL